MNITSWITSHWAGVMLIVWSVDQILKVLGGFGFKVADNLADILGNFLKSIGQQPPKS